MTRAESVRLTVWQALDEGPMGRAVRTEFYREFIACELEQPLIGGGDIAEVATSCAVFVRAVLHWSGRKVTRPARAGQPIIGGWFERLTLVSTCYCPRPDTLCPGDVWWICRPGDPQGYSAHVGVVVDVLDDGACLTAEGGGPPDGTLCRYERRRLRRPDARGRVLQGVWRPDEMDGWQD